MNSGSAIDRSTREVLRARLARGARDRDYRNIERLAPIGGQGAERDERVLDERLDDRQPEAAAARSASAPEWL